MDTAMYIVVNSDIKMSKGKLAAQCCHSACRVTRLIEQFKDPVYKRWLAEGEAKIVLKATEEQVKQLLAQYNIRKGRYIWCVETIDSGLTQIPAGSLTTIAFRPINKKDAPEVLKQLKLL